MAGYVADGTPAPRAGHTAGRFVALDGLRGVAALSVVFFHLPKGPVQSLVPTGYLAVDFFFGLSGFVLAHAYGERLRGAMGAGEFLVRRVIRLWPLYALGTAVGLWVALIEAATPPSLVASLAFGLLFLPVPSRDLSADHRRLFPLNGPAWSLFAELVANFAFALLAPRLGWRLLTVILALSAVALVAVRRRYGDLDAGCCFYDASGGVGRVWWSFFAGLLVYRAWRRLPARRIPFWVFPPLIFAAMVDVLPELMWAFFGFPLIIYLAASAEPARLIRSLCLGLGSASYGVYAIHKPIIELLRMRLDLSSPLAGGLVAAGVLGLALVATAAFDVPVRRLLERLVLPMFGRHLLARDSLVRGKVRPKRDEPWT